MFLVGKRTKAKQPSRKLHSMEDQKSPRSEHAQILFRKENLQERSRNNPCRLTRGIRNLRLSHYPLVATRTTLSFHLKSRNIRAWKSVLLQKHPRQSKMSGGTLRQYRPTEE